MPRWCSRIRLDVTDVRMQRLNDISEADAVAEGPIRLRASGRYVNERGQQYAGLAHHTARRWFFALWDSLHEPNPSCSNPEVIAITFCPTDHQIAREHA